MVNKHIFIGSSPFSIPLELPMEDCGELNQSLGHIVVPTRMDDTEQPALQLATDLALARQARMTVLFLYEVVERDISVHWLDGIERLHQALGSHSERIETVHNLEQLKLRLRGFVERLLPARQLN